MFDYAVAKFIGLLLFAAGAGICLGNLTGFMYYNAEEEQQNRWRKNRGVTKDKA